MQRQVKIGGLIAGCKCGKQPKHYEDRGQHFIECFPCLNRTPRYGTFNEALQAWEHQEAEPIRQRSMS